MSELDTYLKVSLNIIYNFMENQEEHRYSCPRCHHQTDDRTNYIRHLNKKTPCQSLYSDISRSDILSGLKPDKEHKCDKCNKSFSHSSNLYRHKKTHANDPATTINNNTNTNIIDSHDTSIVSNDTITDIHDNINNITIENLTIQLLPFGKEDISQIQNDPEFLNRCIQQGVERAIPLIVKQIFLNDQLPQNKNVRMGTNHQPAEMLVFREDIQSGEPSWEHAPRALVLQDLVDKGANVLQAHNSHIYHTSRKTIDDSEDYDRRNGKIIDAKASKRGTGRIKVAVLDKFKDHEKSLMLAEESSY